MGVTNLQDNKFNTLLQRFKTDFPVASFEESKDTFWDPKNQIIYYSPFQANAIWSLLHEIGHMRKNHKNYKLDIELLKMETEAWQEAKVLGKNYNISIDNDHIEDCLDSYRDWLHKRSSCPKCKQTGIQSDELLYSCINCGQKWKVTVSRFCRSYRRKI